ncbi:hypothetical protein J26TS2_26140 [Shouchella clausii]|nr:hypothetical protein J26TS2_26140 [Shouchella clausii]
MFTMNKRKTPAPLSKSVEIKKPSKWLKAIRSVFSWFLDPIGQRQIFSLAFLKRHSHYLDAVHTTRHKPHIAVSFTFVCIEVKGFSKKGVKDGSLGK